MTKYRTAVRAILLSALVTGAGIRDRAAATPAFTVTDLGTLGEGGGSVGFGINNSGQVTGTSRGHAFLWTPTTPNGASGTMVDLGELGGGGSVGNDVNDHGQVTGYSQTTIGEYTYHAFLYDGALLDLQTLGGTYSWGNGINDSGQVVGYSYAPGDRATLAFMYDGALHDLGSLGGASSEATAINDSGQVTGYSATTGDADSHAFLWTPATPNGDSGTMFDLDALGGTSSIGLAISDSGQVTGRFNMTGGGLMRAFLYDGTLHHDLGTLGGKFSEGRGINDSGQVTGVSSLRTGPGDEGQHAFLYTSDSGMVDLNSLIDPLSGWELYAGYAINDAGQITGGGYIDGQQHAFLLTPVPEPATILLAACGLVTLITVKARRRPGRKSEK